MDKKDQTGNLTTNSPPLLFFVASVASVASVTSVTSLSSATSHDHTLCFARSLYFIETYHTPPRHHSRAPPVGHRDSKHGEASGHDPATRSYNVVPVDISVADCHALLRSKGSNVRNSDNPSA